MNSEAQKRLGRPTALYNYVAYSGDDEVLVCHPNNTVEFEREYFIEGGREFEDYDIVMGTLPFRVRLRGLTFEPHSKHTGP